MMDDERTSKIVERMGFAESDTGPFVTELRGHVARQVTESGLVSRSAGSWDGGIASVPAETRAREMLAMDWAISRGHCYRTEAIDGLWWWQTNLKTMRRRLRVDWAWFGDCWRWLGMKLRINRDYVLGIRNPYRAAAKESGR